MPMWMRTAFWLISTVVWGLFMVPTAYNALYHHGGWPAPFLWAVPGVTWVLVSGRGFSLTREGIRVEAEGNRNKAEAGRVIAEDKRVKAEEQRENKEDQA
jgi:hypothetical protein